MGRKPREEEENGVYHVIQRGNNREFIFGDNMDKEYFSEQLKLLGGSGCKLYGFVVMGNHYHLVLRTMGETLHSVMHRLNLRYSKYYNRKHNRSGHVFQGRYKAVPVRDERYLLSLLRYIHQNPVRAEICQRVEEYGWSSDSHYRENKNEWVETGLVLDMLSGNRKTAMRRYNEFMAEDETVHYENIGGNGEIPNDRISAERIQKTKFSKSLDELLLATGVNEQQFQLIKNGSRQRCLTGYKLGYVREALKQNYTLKAIGGNINVSDVAILDMLRRHNLIT